MSKTSWRMGDPLKSPVQERLRQLIHKHGATETANMLDVARATVVSAAAGAGLRRVTAIAIEAKLASIKSAA